MDNLTHSLVGLTAAKAGLERLSPGATTLCVLAANSPDLDIVTVIFGRWTYLQQHRGVSHSILGVSLFALGLPFAFYLVDLLLAKVRRRKKAIRFPGLLLASVIVTATHPLMDWTNNYGVRLLLPWDHRWFYGDFLFVIDPLFWLILGGAAFLLTSGTKKQLIAWSLIALLTSVLVLVGPSGPRLFSNGVAIRVLWIIVLTGVVLYRRKIGVTRNARIAVVALSTVVVYGCVMSVVHVAALHEARMQAAVIARTNSENVIRVVAMPTVANPTRWLSVMETERATYRFPVSLLGPMSSTPGSDFPETVRYEKPAGLDAQAVERAERDYRSQVFLGFARFPVIRVIGADCATQTLVQFADLRYTEPGTGRGTFSLEVPVECPTNTAR